MADDEIMEGKRPQRARLSDVGERDGLDYAVYQDSTRPPDSMSINPEDGMPQQIPASSMQDNLAPALAVDTFVCMADKSKFVTRDELGNVELQYTPDEVSQSPDGRYWKVTESSRRWALPVVVFTVVAMLLVAWGAGMNPAVVAGAVGIVVVVMLVAEFRLTKSVWLEVEPLRPQCEHYVRQLVPWEDDREHTLCTRYCAALKNEQGELFQLSNQQVLACEMRQPRVAADDAKIDKFDQLIILKGRSRGDEEFDVDRALSNENLGVLGGGK